MPTARVAALWTISWVLFAALWMLLVDTTHPDEIVAGAVCAAIAATASELVRAQRVAVLRISPRWLVRAGRALTPIPADLLLLLGALLRQLRRRERQVGAFVELPFDGRGPERERNGRRALAEGLGSLSPNTYVIGIDDERSTIVVHQLVPRVSREVVDPLGLG